jgi:hypothetical protein
VEGLGELKNEMTLSGNKPRTLRLANIVPQPNLLRPDPDLPLKPLVSFPRSKADGSEYINIKVLYRNID